MVSDSKDRKFGNYKDLTFQDSFAGIRIAEMEASSGLENEEQGDWLDFLPADNLGDPERQDVEVTSNHFKTRLWFHVCLFVYAGKDLFLTKVLFLTVMLFSGRWSDVRAGSDLLPELEPHGQPHSRSHCPCRSAPW